MKIIVNEALPEAYIVIEHCYNKDSAKNGGPRESVTIKASKERKPFCLHDDTYISTTYTLEELLQDAVTEVAW